MVRPRRVDGIIVGAQASSCNGVVSALGGSDLQAAEEPEGW
ncbi:unnamed protein product [Penicillium roqueforti FM164]|uniref:Genomic scaffold, ProqFM164S02 n=1 Tax=Penicillium roqueforti (strain FM164) TaxID=1365484 RepID=W6Q9I2_PENRF|nr:unnamed protein product [Penicillium roqueforti FM164]